MRGISEKQSVMLNLISPENRVPKDHPLRQIKTMADEELKRLSQRFDQVYSHTGRPSIPLERVLKSLLLIAFYSVFPHPDNVQKGRRHLPIEYVCLPHAFCPFLNRG